MRKDKIHFSEARLNGKYKGYTPTFYNFGMFPSVKKKKKNAAIHIH